MRRGVALAAALFLAGTPFVARADHEPGPLWFTQVLEPGFSVAPYAAGAVPATAMAFSPDGDLYVANLSGVVSRYRDIGGIVAGPPEPVLQADRPQGIAFGPDGSLYVSSVERVEVERPWGMITRYAPDGTARKVLGDIPFGVHTNAGMRFGPDGRLHVGVASTSLNGDSPPGEAPEIPPFTMSVLRFDPGDAPLSVLSSPEVDVVATGIHNAYDLAFRGDDLYTASNAPQDQEPLGEDVLVGVLDATARSFVDFGSPGCLYTHDELGWPVAGASDYPSLPDDEETCEGRTPVTAVLGLHRGSTGLAVAPDGFGSFGGDVFVTEWGSLIPPVQGHKIVRVGLEPDGSVTAAADGRPDLSDFLVTTAPIDVEFHGGAMYVADFGTGVVFRVTPL